MKIERETLFFFDDDWSSDMMYRVERFIHKCATTQHFSWVESALRLDIFFSSFIQQPNEIAVLCVKY